MLARRLQLPYKRIDEHFGIQLVLDTNIRPFSETIILSVRGRGLIFDVDFL